MTGQGRDFAGRFLSKVQTAERQQGIYRAPDGATYTPDEIRAAEKAIARERLSVRRGPTGKAETNQQVYQRLVEKYSQPQIPPQPPKPAPRKKGSSEPTPLPRRLVRELQKQWGRKDIYSDFDTGIEPWYYIRVGKKILTIQDENYDGQDYIIDEIVAGFARGAYGDPEPYMKYVVEGPEDFDEFYSFSVGE